MFRGAVLLTFPLTSRRWLSTDKSLAVQPATQKHEQHQEYMTKETFYKMKEEMVHEIKITFYKVFGGVTALGTVAYYLFPNYPLFNQVYEDVSTLLPAAITSSTLKMVEQDTYVNRAELVNELQTSVSMNDRGAKTYTVVFGCKGVGKTTAVHNSFAGKEAVMRVGLIGAFSKDQIVGMIATAILGDKLKTNERANLDQLKVAFAKCKERPTIIFDVERGEGEDQRQGINSIRSLAKELADACNCIIILSEANAIFAFGNDLYREEDLFVDEMTDKEAKQYIKKLIVKNQIQLSDVQIDEIFTKLGRNPAMLNKLFKHLGVGKTLESYIAEVQLKAEQDLDCFPLKELLRELKSHPDGVSRKSLKGKMSGDVELSNVHQVAGSLKTSNAVVYRLDNQSYQLMSTVHRNALKNYNVSSPSDAGSWLYWPLRAIARKK